MAPPPVPGGGKAMVGLSYRDALEKAYRVDGARELEGMLDRAQMTGDEVVLARAQAANALEHRRRVFGAMGPRRPAAGSARAGRSG